MVFCTNQAVSIEIYIISDAIFFRDMNLMHLFHLTHQIPPRLY